MCALWCLLGFSGSRLRVHTELGVTDNKGLLLHLLLANLLGQELLQVLGELSLDQSSDSGQGIGGVLELGESTELDAIVSSIEPCRVQFEEVKNSAVNIIVAYSRASAV